MVERSAMGVVPQPINANQCAELTQLLENPPEGEEDFLLDLITNRVPPSVDGAALTKANFLTSIIKGLLLLIFPFSLLLSRCYARASTSKGDQIDMSIRCANVDVHSH